MQASVGIAVVVAISACNANEYGGDDVCLSLSQAGRSATARPSQASRSSSDARAASVPAESIAEEDGTDIMCLSLIQTGKIVSAKSMQLGASDATARATFADVKAEGLGQAQDVGRSRTSVPMTQEPEELFIHDIFLAVCVPLWLVMVGSIPIVIACVESHLTWADFVQGAFLLVWLCGGVFACCSKVEFRGSWDGFRCLTVTETIYWMAQVITTVGYGDIVPAHKKGQLFVAVFVLVTMVIIADMVGTAAVIVFDRMIKRQDVGTLSRQGKLVAQSDSNRLPLQEFLQAILVFAGFVVLGALVYSNIPGEDKTLFESAYMGIITLSTVGFGTFTAKTEGGMAFGAFWMIFGVTALLRVASSVSELLHAIHERGKPHRLVSKDFGQICDAISIDPHDSQVQIDRTQFLKMVLLRSNVVAREDLEQIKGAFLSFQPGHHGKVDLGAIQQHVKDLTSVQTSGRADAHADKHLQPQSLLRGSGDV